MSIDLETVTLHATYRVGFIAPAPGSLAAGEFYVELKPPEGGAPRLWVGTPDDGTFPGNIASLIPLGVELPPPLPATAPTNTAIPYVSPEQAVPGDTLNCTMGEWEGEPDDYAYDWLSDGTSTGASAGANYTIPPTDAGHTITCVVTATNIRGSTIAPPSNAVLVPAAREASAPTPKRSRD